MSTIGFTAGVFDMFHIGHLNFIKNAKSNCDYLIVGVNTDELVEQYKMKQPVVPYEERVKIISELRSVDEVMPIETLDKEIIWKNKPYNVLFIGDDWMGNPRWVETERVMLKYNVKTIYLPYTHTTNSTLLREKLENING